MYITNGLTFGANPIQHVPQSQLPLEYIKMHITQSILFLHTEHLTIKNSPHVTALVNTELQPLLHH